MTLTTIVNRVADLVSMDRPNSITGSSGQTEREWLALANEAGKDIQTRAEWPQLYASLAVAATVSSATLPADFHRLIAGGAVMEGGASTAFIRGATSSDQWRLIKKLASAQPYFFISGTSMEFYPDTTANGATINYITTQWVKPESGLNTTEFMSDTDTTLFSEDLMVKGIIWRWRRNNGLDYQDQIAEYEADFATEARAAKGITA